MTHPLLLIDDNQILTLLREGTYKFDCLTFAEVEAIIETHQADDISCCFTHPDIEAVVFDYLHLDNKDFSYVAATELAPGQDAIAFKRYVTPSETRPIIHVDNDFEAKKVRNEYIYCQLITRID